MKPPAARLGISVRGAVQGVGFRPFAYRLAEELGLAGWVLNDARGVELEIEGERGACERFLERLQSEPPPRAILESVATRWLDPLGTSDFEIRTSHSRGLKSAVVLPDVATCSECLTELLDPADRRHRYPFINCTHCGPRFTIVEALPYDRPNTTMKGFVLCPECRREHEDPRDRRFHAQPNACPKCGPRLVLEDVAGSIIATGEAALSGAAAALIDGNILALKGLGGFQLLVDARDGAAVTELRRRKARWEKPFALMVRDLETARALCEVPPAAAAVLTGPEAPIVLLARRPGAVAEEVAPANPWLGVMLPTTPLHHLLLRAVAIPLIATSGNRSDEPIAIGDDEAHARLGKIADLFLRHDRPIARHADDSVVAMMVGQPRLLRRARGYAPLPILTHRRLPTLLAVGPQLKTTVALSLGERVFVSQHLGDLDTPETLAAFERVIADFLRLYEAEPEAIVHDLHPDYASTRWAERIAAGGDPRFAALAGLPLVGVQHHHAHLAACLLENGCDGPALGVCWDGTGHGSDATVWGGEFLLGDAAGYDRIAHLRPFRLPGGEAAVREPRRAALALLWELWGEQALERDDLAPIRAFEPRERRVLGQMLARGVNAPLTSSLGRLADAVAALLDVHQITTFEGQAAMALEFAVDGDETGVYPLPLTGARPIVLDWEPLLHALLEDLAHGTERGRIAARFHNALVAAIVGVARAVGEPRVALTGGCFQNRILTERASEELQKAGFEVLLHRQVPPGDGGISLGQVAVAAARRRISGG